MCLGRIHCRRPYPIPNPLPHPLPHPVPHPPIVRPIPPPIKPENVLETVPLVGAHIHSEIHDLNAKVRVSQRYVNNGPDTLELSYEFPLPVGASVCSFTAEIDGKRVKSVLKEKNKAKETYDDAIASGHGAYLAEKEETGNFKSSIGSLPPSKEVSLILEYVVSLHYDGHQVHLQFKGNDQITSAKQANENVRVKDGGISEGITVTAHIVASSSIVEVTSPGSQHQIEWNKGANDREANVQFKNLQNAINKDICLSFQTSEPFKPTYQAEKDSEGNVTSSIAFHPDLEAEESNDQVFTELIFLVDCSGSMSGSPMKAVNQTLQIFLRSLPETCLFNIIDFGSSSVSLFPNYESQKYSESTFERAVSSVESKTACLGGTDLLPPLRKIFAKSNVQGYSRQIFLLTDGQVSNSSECIQECAKNAHDTRVFTFGIGSDVDVNLVREIAKESNGSCELLPYGSKFEEPVMRQLIRALKPSISNLSFHVEGLSAKDVQTTPFHPPPIYAGDRVVFYINLDKSIASKHQKLETKLSGYIGAKAFTQSITVDLNECKTVVNREDALVAYLYGSSAIQDFEKKRSFLHTAEGKLANGVSQDQVNKKILETSLKTGILSKLTAFVAVEERDGSVTDVPKQLELKTEEVNQRNQNSVSPRSSLNPIIPYPAPVPLMQPAFGYAHQAYGGDDSSEDEDLFERKAPKKKEGGLLSSIKSGMRLKKVSAPAPVQSQQNSLSDTLARSMSSRRDMSYEEECDDSDDWDDGAVPMQLEQQSKDKFFAAPKSSSYSLLPPPPPASIAPSMSPGAPSVGGVSAFGGGFNKPTMVGMSAPRTGGVSAFGGGGFGMSTSISSVTTTSTSSSSSQSKTNIDPNLPVANRLVQSQNSNGSFKDVALSMMGISKEELKNNLPSGSGAEAESIFLAALVCAFLEAKCQNDKTSWTLVVKKARNWIKKESEKLKVEPSVWEQAASTVVACL